MSLLQSLRNNNAKFRDVVLYSSPIYMQSFFVNTTLFQQKLSNTRAQQHFVRLEEDLTVVSVAEDCANYHRYGFLSQVLNVT